MVRRKLGQHFLTDDGVARREVGYAHLSPQDVVLEIGPGKGVLTQMMAPLVHRVVAIELDAMLASALREEAIANVSVIQGDAVAIDFSTLPRWSKVVANLPFAISSPITAKLLSSPFERGVLIYQWEFARRMVALPGTPDYSRLSVLVSYKAFCRILERVPKSSFSPPPEVDAAIVELLPLPAPAFPVQDEDFFFALVRQLFSHRRKKIRTVLKTIVDDLEGLPFLDDRVETVSPQDLGRLSDLVAERERKKT